MNQPLAPGDSTPKGPLDHGKGGSLSWVRGGIVFVGGTMLLVMMALTIVDVIGRYIFNSPLAGAGELTELILVSVIFMGLPAVTLEKEHTTVDLFTARMPQWTERWRTLAIGVFSAVILGTIGWQLWIHAGRIAAYGDVSTTLRIPIAPVAYFCSLSSFASAIAAVMISFEPLFQRPGKG